jgi:16S rRNA (guanine527-N7)-methyltransferase
MDPARNTVGALVSRESLGQLDRYVELLQQWQTTLNLIGSSTTGEIWERHILDSLQLLPLLPDAPASVIDLGSGAGFPGLPLAICRRDLCLFLVESIQRKAAFLREAARVSSASARILCQRAERLSPEALGGQPDIIISRAAAPLDRLFKWGSRVAGSQTIYLLHKGQDVDAELTEATKCWNFKVIRHPSRLRNGSWILEVRHVFRSK